jgi:hypothetical protein
MIDAGGVGAQNLPLTAMAGSGSVGLSKPGHHLQQQQHQHYQQQYQQQYQQHQNHLHQHADQQRPVPQLPSPPQARLRNHDIVSGVNSFGDLFSSKLKGMGVANSFFLSPFALYSSLLLLANTVNNSPRKELLEVLQLGAFGLEDINEQTKLSISKFLSGNHISINNAVWTAKHPISSTFKSVCMDKYFAAAYSCSSTQTVNSWCLTTSQGYLSRVFEESAPLPRLTFVSSGAVQCHVSDNTIT